MLQDTKKGNRNMGIDLLRIVSMLFVVVIHVMGRGGMLNAAEPMSVNYEIVWFINVAVYCAVNCYALISGYVGFCGKFRCANLGILWLRVVFYTVIITVLFRFGMPETVGKREVINAFFPASTEQYWYFTAYTGMFFFIPVLNYFINHASQGQLKLVVIMCVLLFSVMPTVFRNDAFQTVGGYSVFWLMILYLIGGYIGKYGLWKKKSMWSLGLLYVVCIVLTWVSKFVIEYRSCHVGGTYEANYLLVSYTSPTILLAGVALVLLFSRMTIGHRFGKIILFLAPTAFSVYLIHFHPLVKGYILQDRFAHWVTLEPWKMCGRLVVVVAVIYVGCTLIDLVREALFKKLGVKNKLVQLENNIVDKMKTK